MLPEAILIIVCVFLLSGGVALTLFLINPTVIAQDPYPQQLPYAPHVMFLLSLGVMGTFILYAGGRNGDVNPTLSQRQIAVGGSLVVACFVGMALVSHIVFS